MEEKNKTVSDTEFWQQANQIVGSIEKHKGITRKNRSNKELILSLLKDMGKSLKEAYDDGSLAENCKVTVRKRTWERIHEALLECPYCKNTKDFPLETVELNDTVFFENCLKCKGKFAVKTKDLCQAYADYYK